MPIGVGEVLYEETGTIVLTMLGGGAFCWRHSLPELGQRHDIEGAG
jgi:hypothetical protein